MIDSNYFHGAPCVASIDICTGADTNMTIKNNVFHVHPTTYEGIVRFYTDEGSGHPVNGLYIWNNTFVSTPQYDGIIYFDKGNNQDNLIFSNVDIRNNIIDTDSNGTFTAYLYCRELCGNGAGGRSVNLRLRL